MGSHPSGAAPAPPLTNQSPLIGQAETVAPPSLDPPELHLAYGECPHLCLIPTPKGTSGISGRTGRAYYGSLLGARACL